jgi:hypothetical protein
MEVDYSSTLETEIPRNNAIALKVDSVFLSLLLASHDKHTLTTTHHRVVW